jgi:predicted permease
MRPSSRWVRLTSVLVPTDLRAEWIEEWEAELTARGGSMTYAWGAIADAWYLRTEGWTMDAMVRDVRTAVRGLARNPFFTGLAGVTLAVGIAANTAIFSVVDGVLINPLPFPEPERLVSYNHEAPGLGVNVPLIPHSQAMYLHYEANARELEAFAVVSNSNVNLVTEGDPQQLSAAVVTRRYFDVLGVQPMLGRAFVEGEDRPGAEPVAILGYGLWEQSFGANPSVLGQLVELDGTRRRVIGVMPERFSVLNEELWIPMTIDPEAPDGGSLGLIGFGRLAAGATPESADVEMQELLMRFAAEHADELPPGVMEQAGLASDVKPLKEVVVEDVRQVLWVLLGTVGIVLLVACANVANLFLVRAEARQREQALRTALGAGRLQIARQYLAESVTLALGAGVLGLVLAEFGVRGLLALAPADLPQALDIGIDGSVLLFAAAISLASGLVFGVVPAFGSRRRDLSNALKDGGRASTGGKDRMRARSGLVVAQVALALVLLVGSGLMLRSFVALKNVDPGFDTEGLVTFSLGLPSAEYQEPASVLDFQRQLADRLAAMPGVEAVGMINGLPLSEAKSAGPMEPVEQPFPEGELGPMIERRRVSPDYFRTMSIRIVEGRALEWTDQADEARSIVVSETLARTFWPDQSALGKAIRSQGEENDPWEVVGVAADVRFDGVAQEPLPMAYQPVLGGNVADPDPTRGFDVVVKVAGDPLAVIAPAREELRAIDGRLPMITPRSVASIVEDSMAATSFTVVLLGIAAGVALLLGTVGIYGVVAYVVSRRTQEIGVRMALGAPAGVVLSGFLRQGLVLTGIGVALGLLASFGLSRVLASLLYGVSATDPVTFSATAALLVGVSLLATWLPARRASRVDPVEALRGD